MSLWSKLKNEVDAALDGMTSCRCPGECHCDFLDPGADALGPDREIK